MYRQRCLSVVLALCTFLQGRSAALFIAVTWRIFSSVTHTSLLQHFAGHSCATSMFSCIVSAVQEGWGQLPTRKAFSMVIIRLQLWHHAVALQRQFTRPFSHFAGRVAHYCSRCSQRWHQTFAMCVKFCALTQLYIAVTLFLVLDLAWGSATISGLMRKKKQREARPGWAGCAPDPTGPPSS